MPPLLVRASLSLLLLAAPHFTAGREIFVRDLDAKLLSYVVGREPKHLVLMYDGACAPTKAFQPWLYALANALPHLPMGQIDVNQSSRQVAEAFKVSTSPQIKIFVRDNPVGERIVDYRGPLDYDALMGWCRALLAGESHELSSFGVEPPESPDVAKARAAGKAGRGGSMMDKLPPSVRAMAETMVMETRLQKLLKERGGGRYEQYNEMVAQRYNGIVAEEGTDVDDKFEVQEANRRARDAVREELLKEAPDYIKAEIEGEINLGDMKNPEQASAAAGEGRKKKGKAKDEL